eukprot:1134220-Pelagomonas_calceolata.AAC.2
MGITEFEGRAKALHIFYFSVRCAISSKPSQNLCKCVHPPKPAYLKSDCSIVHFQKRGYSKNGLMQSFMHMGNSKDL